MPQPFRVLLLNKTHKRLKLFKDELPDKSKTTTPHMTVAQLCLIILVGDPLKTDAWILACSCSTELFMAMQQYKYQHILRNPSHIPSHALFLLQTDPHIFNLPSRFTQQELFSGINSSQRLFLRMILTLSKKE